MDISMDFKKEYEIHKEFLKELYRQNERCKRNEPGAVEMWKLANDLAIEHGDKVWI
jgi:hypothetical protein